jgi:hypothetical protein
MGMEIVRTVHFNEDANRLNLTTADVKALEDELVRNPTAGDKIEGLKGLRKVRFGIPSRNIGKSGGGRAITLVWEREGVVVLLMAYGKREQTDLSRRQRKALLEMLEELNND